MIASNPSFEIDVAGRPRKSRIGADLQGISAIERIPICWELCLIGDKAGNFVCGCAAALPSAPGL
jgi:hypothetical protein